MSSSPASVEQHGATFFLRLPQHGVDAATFGL